MSWTDCELGDVVTLKRGHDLPNDRRVEGDIPVVSSSGITGWHNEAKAEPPGVVTGRYGTIGEVFYLDRPYWPLNTALYAIDFHGNSPKFIAYFLRNQLKNYQSEKAAVPGVDRNVLHKIKVRCPDPQSQDRIVSILSAYDDLIENNRRRIALLEQAARLLYREWFVHLRFPGHETVKIIDGLPEGWQRQKVRDLLQALKAKPKIRKDEYQRAGRYPCIDQGQTFIGGYTDNTDAIYRDELPLIVFGDHTRSLKFVNFPFARGADGTQIIKSNSNLLSQEQFYFALMEVDLSNYFYARHFKFLKDQEIVIPNESTGAKFTLITQSIFSQIDVLNRQVFEATRARDLLLPRLMDGRILV
ncbi:restriction endonuclease subunit S [Pseudochrobactrum kiredjianiae]|uniref:Restriction endonuclease subunit S n=1 Tax=Pseudochrobactrum kiredjianiae TaxID=386305 RepID=A0ABW3V1R7_9HYPH|nr:restriction endonuclease subunit S [Pseudochrobactrum kiredjianiae]MDM7852102.1 restriction endonuclease subunit S [Pseudochrobactrum kiredjianiae]